MGERGHTIHLRDGGARDALPSVGHRVAVLGTNERWTTFVPMDASTFDCERASELLDRAVLEVWFDDDVGVAIQVYSSGDFIGEFALPGEDGDVTEADLELVRKLEDMDVLSRSQRATLLKHLSDTSDTDGLRDWTMKHGIEKLLDLPFYTPMPSDLPESALRNLLPSSAMVLVPTNASSPKASKAKARKPKAAPAASQPAPAPPSRPPRSLRTRRRTLRLRERERPPLQRPRPPRDRAPQTRAIP